MVLWGRVCSPSPPRPAQVVVLRGRACLPSPPRPATMGIPGLLQFIKEATEPAHIKKYKGQVVAVDTYCWLHKGAYACAEKLARAEPTDQYVIYCMKLVDMLLSFGVKPVLVFDGCTLPSKMEVEKSRREKRQANFLKGKQLLREGKLSEARERFARSINVTHAMACEVIKAARTKGIDCIVAPYEADAQLAYLNKTGIVQAIITEDSDLLAFGCKKVFLKLDKFGNGLEIDQARLGMCKQLGDVFTEEKFRYMCILSGCDYLPSIHGIGLNKACKLLKIANNPDIIKSVQPRSCSWDDKPLGEKPSNFKSIWSRDYKPGFAVEMVPDSAPLLERPPTKGTERLINTKGLKLPHKAMLAKRQRHEEVSDGDLLSQYSFSNSKKPKTEKGEDIKHHAVDSAVIPVPVSVDPSSNNSQPRLRNKFAFLQKKEAESHVVVPGTRSRRSVMPLVPQQQMHSFSSYHDTNKILGKAEIMNSPVLESACSSEPDCNLKSQISPFFESLHTEKDTVLGTLVFGLHKTSPVRSCVVTKCKSLMPAKVSGLSKRMANTKKKNHHNAENKSGLQVTINELWKSFQFRRQSERLPSCKKPEPLSPIKDNIQLTPDTDDDAFNKLEFSHVQRKIFQ
ncbi:UNVERIFIED_CONTAM: hypothetical protein K2H54_058465 [Gekko kuhli]